jgi:hypothetical protein
LAKKLAVFAQNAPNLHENFLSEIEVCKNSHLEAVAVAVALSPRKRAFAVAHVRPAPVRRRRPGQIRRLEWISGTIAAQSFFLFVSFFFYGDQRYRSP